MFSRLVNLTLLLVASLMFMQGALAELSANELIKQNENKIVQVIIVNRVSAQKVSFGSGFFVNTKGLLVSNYHVVSRVVMYPEDYVVRYINSLGEEHEAVIVDVDVINDLALLQTDQDNTEFFTLADDLPKQGEPLYSIGNPYDLGMIVVPGTFNGLINHRFTDEINLTGSINPGMSGGPTIDANAKVVGINVTTMGNQIGSLVPVGKLHTLITTYQASDTSTPIPNKDFFDKITQQLTRYQASLFTPILSAYWPVDTLGSALVPQKIAEFLSCGSGSNQSNEKRQYEGVGTGCRLNERIYLNRSSSLLGFSYGFEWRQSNQLNQWQLSTLYQNGMRKRANKSRVHSRDTTNYHCEEDLVINDHNNTMKTSLCTRAYRLYPGLFDVSFRALLLGKDYQAIIATFTLNGVTASTGQAFTSKFVENIKWN